MAIISSHISGLRKTFVVNQEVNYEFILQLLLENEGTCEGVLLCSGGKVLDSQSTIQKDTSVVATLKLCGGKGGFGSMLRAIGAQIEKTTNREACRDLSGRRLRDINEEKRLKEYLQNKKDRQKEREEKRKQKMEKLREVPKHFFEDKSYAEQRDKREKDIYDSVDKALSSSSGKKRKMAQTALPIKKRKMHFEHDFDVSSDDSSEDESSDNSEKSSSSDKESKTSSTDEAYSENKEATKKTDVL